MTVAATQSFRNCDGHRLLLDESIINLGNWEICLHPFLLYHIFVFVKYTESLKKGSNILIAGSIDQNKKKMPK